MEVSRNNKISKQRLASMTSLSQFAPKKARPGVESVFGHSRWALSLGTLVPLRLHCVLVQHVTGPPWATLFRCRAGDRGRLEG